MTKLKIAFATVPVRKYPFIINAENGDPILYFRKSKWATQEEFEQVIEFLRKSK